MVDSYNVVIPSEAKNPCIGLSSRRLRRMKSTQFIQI